MRRNFPGADKCLESIFEEIEPSRIGDLLTRVLDKLDFTTHKMHCSIVFLKFAKIRHVQESDWDWQASFVIDDGTGQAQLYVDGEELVSYILRLGKNAIN